MSLRTMERILLSTSLIFGLSAMGCGDGDDVSSDAGTKPMDSGVKDAGPKDSGPKADTGGDEEELPSMACGSNTCTGILLSEVVVDPCCVVDGAGKATDQCGLDSVDIKRVNSTSPFSGCVPKDVPKASDSAYCGEFWDQVEMGGKVNGGLDIKSGSVTLTFDGCCLPTGECGALIDTPRGQNADDLNTHLGCVSFTRLSTALNGADAGAVAQPEHLPYCNSSTGSPLKGDETVTGKPKFVCGCGDGKVDEGKGTFPCFNNLPTTVCGADQPKAEELAMIPEFICGCTQASKLPCMVNVAAATCGTKQIDANSVELALVPVFICGESATPSALPTLKGVDPAVCGKKVPSAGDLAEVPEFMCGCTANSKLPCLRNVDANTCGGKPITTTSTTELMQLPEYICGCGADTVDPGTSVPCLSHVEQTTCGAVPVTTSAALDQLPKLLCGCGDGVVAPRCLANVPADLCGSADATAALAGVPDSLCGCGENVLAGPRPCLNNLPTSSCGGLDVPTSQITYLPASLCGCGASVTYEPGTSPSPCLSKTAQNECGGGTIPTSDPNNTPSDTADDCYTGLPAYARGCGVGTVALTCIPNGSTSTFGCVQPGAGAVVPNQPEFACGCGVGVIGDGTCVPNIGTDSCGTLAVTTGSPALGLVPKFRCGCDGSNAPELGCMRNVESSVCGTAAPTVAQLALVPEFICGCGTSKQDVGIGPTCMSFVDTATCGTKNTEISVRADLGNTPCLVGLPEYAIGCGDGVAPSGLTDTCLRGAGSSASPASKIPGCVNVEVGNPSLRRLPEYLCGCGETAVNATGRGDAVLTCLPFVADTVCGTWAIQSALQLSPLMPNTLCGCGDNVNTTAGACLDNVPGSLCGPVAVCTLGQTGEAAGCSNAGAPVCVDRQGGVGAGVGGAGGAGDGVGDHCIPVPAG